MDVRIQNHHPIGPTIGDRHRSVSRGVRSLLQSNVSTINRINTLACRATGKGFRATICRDLTESLRPGYVLPDALVDALELLQYFTLVHDDIIDGSHTRRGFQSLWSRFGENAALLYGDYMHARVFETLASRLMLPAAQFSQIFLAFATASRRVQEGQMEELQNRYNVLLSTSQYLGIAELKTSSMIHLAASLAVILAKRGEKVVNALKDFSKYFGQAFQVYNDVIDYLPGHGKEQCDDIRSGTMSYPIILLMSKIPRGHIIRKSYERRAIDRRIVTLLRQAVIENHCLEEAFFTLRRMTGKAEACLNRVIPQTNAAGIRKIMQRFLSLESELSGYRRWPH